MEFETFLKLIPKIEKKVWTKDEVHLPMAPEFRNTYPEDFKKDSTRNAAVMPIIYPKNGIATMVFIQRPIYKGAHSGQIAFAGGKEEKEDITFLDTAFREVEEEIGVKPSSLCFLKELHSLYITPSDFRVYPFLSFSKDQLTFVLQEEEVAGILEVPLYELLNKESKSTLSIEKEDKEYVDVPAYTFDSYKIWGATAMILHEVELLLRYSLEV